MSQCQRRAARGTGNPQCSNSNFAQPHNRLPPQDAYVFLRRLRLLGVLQDADYTERVHRRVAARAIKEIIQYIDDLSKDPIKSLSANNALTGVKSLPYLRFEDEKLFGNLVATCRKTCPSNYRKGSIEIDYKLLFVHMHCETAYQE